MYSEFSMHDIKMESDRIKILEFIQRTKNTLINLSGEACICLFSGFMHENKMKYTIDYDNTRKSFFVYGIKKYQHVTEFNL